LINENSKTTFRQNDGLNNSQNGNLLVNNQKRSNSATTFNRRSPLSNASEMDLWSVFAKIP
jgi:hypothetical protein